MGPERGEECQEAPPPGQAGSKADAGGGHDQSTAGVDSHPVLLFDGDCGLCARSVQFVSRRDPEGVFRFAPLRSPVGEGLVEGVGAGSLGDTLVLLLDGRVLVRSEAVRAILLHLPGWRWVGALLGLVPRPLRDLGYRLVARIRRWVIPPPGACPLPDPRIRGRVLPAAGSAGASTPERPD